MTAKSLALTVFSIALLGFAWMIGGAGAWMYLLIYLLALAPGLPLGFALFGRHHAAGWIAAAIIGYALTAFAIWMPIAARKPSVVTFAASWVLVSALSFFACRRMTKPAVALPAWTPAGSTALLAVLVLTLAVATPPFARVGRSDADGNRYYRAYFTADFVWHMALTSEIAKFAMPPRNPYLARQPIHYYWTYYLLPAAVSEVGPPAVRDVQLCLKVNALMTGLLLMSSVFLSAWTVAGRAVASAIASGLGLLASSAEGIYETFKLWQRGVPLSELRNWNIDAVTAWPPLGGHRIDGLQRCLWYVPQHSMAYALGIVALVTAASLGPSASLSAIALCGIALGCSVAFNPLVGGIFALAYGLSIAAAGWKHPATVLRHAIAAVPVAAALVWCASNQMVEGAGGFLQFGFLGASRNQPIVTLLLSLGPILMTGAAGLIAAGGLPFAPALPYAILAGLSLFLMYFVRLSVDQAWMAFRAGQMMIIALAALTARFIAASMTPSRRLAASTVIVLALITGAPTTIIDEYNAQDIHNLSMGPGFPWTVVVTTQHQRAFAWIKANTPATAVVQMDARSRERSTWSNIPSFAERRMAGGLPISLLNIPEYAERSDRIRAMYSTGSPQEAENIAHSLRIDYVYVDEVERRAYPNGIRFDGSKAFEKVFEEDPVVVYRVR
ncbi:MAG TPA: hypothetical protein VFT39_00775 [Vicinamibacterales bacterium]|nr:hypothetical protein [Vicinamibacterales bacterium]